MNKNIIFIVLFLFIVFGHSIKAQNKEFKLVKTGDDVIENYITANGGRDNLELITSIKMKGIIEALGKSLPMIIYTSNDYFFVKVDEPTFGSTAVVDRKNKAGWQKAMGTIKDFNDEELNEFEEIFEGNLWGHLLYKDRYNLKYELKGVENVGYVSAFVVNFTRDSILLYTTYFDTSNYNRIKQIKNGKESNFEDFRLVNNSNIKMPYKITEQVPITVQEYEFNTVFDTLLLIKPEIKQ